MLAFLLMYMYASKKFLMVIPNTRAGGPDLSPALSVAVRCWELDALLSPIKMACLRVCITNMVVAYATEVLQFEKFDVTT